MMMADSRGERRSLELDPATPAHGQVLRIDPGRAAPGELAQGEDEPVAPVGDEDLPDAVVIALADGDEEVGVVHHTVTIRKLPFRRPQGNPEDR